MAFEQIEKQKRNYTDQYVTVVGGPPELARFAGVVGQVKTVNMSGRALVEWLGYHQNIGWYDIDLDYLKIVPQPAEPEAEKKSAAKKPAAKTTVAKKPGGKSPLEILRAQGGTKNKATRPEKSAEDKGTGDESKPKGKPSTAAILAQLRKKKDE